MKLAHFLSAAAISAGMLLAPAAASAQQTIDSLGLTIATTPAATTDYLFRGISQTRGRPAAQLTVDVEHSSGLYVGAFVSNATFVGTNIRQEVDGLFGYRFALGDVKFDIGATYFGYPGYTKPPGGFEAAWWEVNLRASYELDPVKLLGLVAWSPNFNLESGQAWYAEAGLDVKLPFDVTASLRAGYQWIEYNTTSPAGNGFFGTPDYAVLSVSLSREILLGFIGAVTVSHTTLDEQDCFGGLKFCGTRVIGTLSRPF
jgi:uncharacterized protein (TIGR02001 family)